MLIGNPRKQLSQNDHLAYKISFREKKHIVDNNNWWDNAPVGIVNAGIFKKQAKNEDDNCCNAIGNKNFYQSRSEFQMWVHKINGDKSQQIDDNYCCRRYKL